MRSSPVVKFLSPSAQKKKDEELRRLEQHMEGRERERVGVTDLEPIPS